MAEWSIVIRYKSFSVTANEVLVTRPRFWPPPLTGISDQEGSQLSIKSIPHWHDINVVLIVLCTSGCTVRPAPFAAV
jgi:hypothetical protein